jgi:hypothetical protein
MSYLAEQMPGGGGYIISGSTNSRGAGSYDIYLIKTDSLGDTLWTRAYGGASYDEGWAGQTAEGGYIICGSTMSYGAGGTDIWLIKTNASGDTLWTRTYGGASDDYGYSAQQVWDGSHAGYVIAGYTESFGAGGNDVYLVRTDLAGDTLWTRTYGGASDDYGYDVQQTSDYGYIVTGYTTSFGTGSNDVYLIKTDANGSVGVEAPRSDRQVVAGRLKATPNPFTSFATIPGHEAERFDVYDISGKMVGIFRGDRVGEGLSPAVYFIRLDDRHGGATGIVKVR